MAVLTPTPEQLAWQQLRCGMFFHLGVNTFVSQEWSDGTVPAEVFDPTGLDCEQWMQTAVEAGARYVVLTAKHHDGFCLWPTATTDYSVAGSPWRDGRGDVVAEFAAAARRAGLGVGLYLSPWDRNAACYPDQEAYSRFYATQLTELCTRYGELVELWFDGAGSEGYEYDWPAIMAVVRTHQPQAMVFNMGAPTIRWVGNEDGLASEPVEYVVPQLKMSNYTVVSSELVDALYLPPECDVSLRRGWFHRADDAPKTAEHLLAIHYRSVGLGANLLLNVPPSAAGTIDTADAAVVAAYGAEVRRRFGSATEAGPSEVGRGEAGVAAEHPGLQETAPGRWRLDLGVDVELDHLWLEEDLTAGQRVTGHRVLLDGVELVRASTVGATRIHLLGAAHRGRVLTVELDGVGTRLTRLRVLRTGDHELPQVPAGYLAPTERPED